jgi:uncharacterized protein YeaO (DUF488 family)
MIKGRHSRDVFDRFRSARQNASAAEFDGNYCRLTTQMSFVRAEVSAMITTKRIYEMPQPTDGWRVLVERLWPRGMTREAARLDDWAKDLSPSPDLRRDFKSDALDWPAFVARYRAELGAPERAAALDDLRQRARKGNVTLLYAKSDPIENSAVILREVLSRKGR